MNPVSKADSPDDAPAAAYGYVMLGALLVVPMALRAEWSLGANVAGLLSATAGILHVHCRTIRYPVRPQGMIDERDYTLALLGVGAFLGAEYANYRVTAYFLLAGFLASYWNGKVVAERSDGAAAGSGPPRRGPWRPEATAPNRCSERPWSRSRRLSPLPCDLLLQFVGQDSLEDGGEPVVDAVAPPSLC